MTAANDAERQLHLGVFALATGHHADGWRMPGALARADDFPALLSIARFAERAKLDFVFFADAPSSAPEGPPGFMLTPASFPGELEVFCDLVVPELRRRGLFRTDDAGTTLRSHFGLPVPRNRFAT